MIKYVLLFILVLTFSGCDNVKELENRDYVMGIGIEKNESSYNVITAISKLSKDKEKNSEEIFLNSQGGSINEAIENINNDTKGDLYLGHNKILILDSKFDDYSSLVDYSNNNNEIGRDTIIVKAENPIEAIKKGNNEDTTSKYVYSYFKGKESVDLGQLIDKFYNQKEIKIPEIKIENNSVIIK